MFSKSLLSFLSMLTCLKASSWHNLTVNIAVVGYQPVHSPVSSQDERIMQNAISYIQILRANNSTELDMVVFPEATLQNTVGTAVKIGMDNPCLSSKYPQFLKDLSCSARDFQIYLVINLIEKDVCDKYSQSSNCQNFGYTFYNTDIIFNRNGTIIQKYRKYNLFAENDLDKPKLPEKIVFETDFGIRFGIFTCFDILFKSPAQDLLKERPDAIIFPSMWYSELPFLTALQTQQMWAYAHNVPFFGAGANEPRMGSGGSGVYEGSKSTAIESIVANGGSKMLLYKSVNGSSPSPAYEDVDILAKTMDGFILHTDPSIMEFNFTILDTLVGNVEKEICHGENENRFCCNFDIRMSKKNVNSQISYKYFLVAFSGVRSYRRYYNGGTELCSVIACTNSSLLSCGQRFPNYEEIGWPIIFENITIKAKFEKNENKTQFPNSLLSSIRPINASETSWIRKEVEENGKRFVERCFSLKKSQNRLLTFAIYGRDFSRDFPPARASTNSIIPWLSIGCILILSYYVRPTQ